MVGTAVYHVGLASSNWPKNFSALKPVAQKTEPPLHSVANTAARRP